MSSKFHFLGIVVEDAIVVVNHQLGGEVNVINNGIRMHSFYTLSELLVILEEAGKIDEKTVAVMTKYISETQVKAMSKQNIFETLNK